MLFAGVALDVMYDCGLVCIRLIFGVDQQGLKRVGRPTVGGNPVLLKDMSYKEGLQEECYPLPCLSCSPSGSYVGFERPSSRSHWL